jgi:hypothetical protein
MFFPFSVVLLCVDRDLGTVLVKEFYKIFVGLRSSGSNSGMQLAVRPNLYRVRKEKNVYYRAHKTMSYT